MVCFFGDLEGVVCVSLKVKRLAVMVQGIHHVNSETVCHLLERDK